MALQYDFTTCDRAKIEALDPTVLQRLIFCTMFTGTGPTITEENVQTFFTRIRTWERVYALQAPTEADRPITVAEVEAVIGLRVNVPMWTDTRFGNEMRRQLIELCEEQATREWKDAHA